jgi:hypothetical protein
LSIGFVPVNVISSKIGEKCLSMYSLKLQEIRSETSTLFFSKFLFMVKNALAFKQGCPKSFHSWKYSFVACFEIRSHTSISLLVFSGSNV